MLPNDSLNSFAHVIQTALTPVFLLSGIAALLNVFNQRLSRVADHYEHISELRDKTTDADDLAGFERHLARLRRRRSALDTTVILAALAGVGTCGAAFALFLVTLRDVGDSMVLLLLFGAALGCTIAALMAFLVDTVLAWHGLNQDGPMPRGTTRPASG